MKTQILILCLSIISLACLGQQFTSNNWYFGYNAGVDFNYGVPTVVTNGQIHTGEGCASIGDSNGNLLFYTDGVTVWNKNHQIMPNGTGLLGHFDASQSAIIVPHPEDAQLFYIFTVDAGANQLQNGLSYSIVNLNLQNGLGDVTSSKNIMLKDTVCEKLIAVGLTNSNESWVVVHEWNSNNFLSYHISTTGLDTVPIVSSIGSIHQGGGSSGYANSVGCMKANLSGNKIAVAIHSIGTIELFDFNNYTGELSNCITGPGYANVFGVEFSPDGNLLYATKIYGNSKLWQFDLSLSNPLSSPLYTLNSPTGLQISTLQIAPDGKIYASELYSYFLNVINLPNEPGSVCNYLTEAIYLEGNTCMRGLPPCINSNISVFSTGTITDTIICSSDSIYLGNAFQNTSGTYYDTLTSYLGCDSIVNVNLTVLPNPPIPTITNTQGFLSTDIGYSYQWYFFGIPISGATLNIYNTLILGPGEYQVEITNGQGCSSISDVYSVVLSEAVKDNIITDIFPNPAKDILLINASGVFSMTVWNIYGQEILSKSVNTHETEIDVSQWNNGIYWLYFQQNNKSTIQKIVVQK